MPHREPGGHMKINLPVFKEKDTKDAIMYKSWCWDWAVYHHIWFQDCTLLPYIICSLQGYPGELVRSSGMDNTLDDVLTILDEHYSNVKALDALNQELFQLCMGDKEIVLGGAPVEIPPGSHSIIPGMFPSGLHSQVETWPFLWWTP